MNPLTQITDEMRRVVHANYGPDKDSLERMFGELRKIGVWQMMAIVLLVEELNIPLAVANRFVGKSKVWG